MASRDTWLYRLLFAGLSLAVLFVALLPFDGVDLGLAGPDVILCLTIAWVQRRPDYVPVWLLLPVLLLSDILTMRPIGLWTLVVFLLAAALRRRVDHSEAQTLGSEVITGCGLIAGAFVANQVALVLLVAETPPLAAQALHAIVTMAFYPLAVGLSRLVGVRRLAPGELDTLGTRA